MKIQLPAKNELIRFLGSFYLIGLAGFVVPFLKPFFLYITPLSIIFIVLLMLFYHQSKKRFLFIALSVSVFAMGMIAEIVGVKTGLIFGNYIYGKTLGPKFMEVPLLIGLNWFYVTYMGTTAVSGFNIRPWLKWSLSAVLITLYDVTLEPAAIWMGMWSWDGGNVHWKNYIAWFILGFFFSYIIDQVAPKNKIAPWIMLVQSIFFLIIGLLARYIF